MKRIPLLPGTGLLALLLFIAASPQSFAASGVRDQAHLFSPDAVSRAEGIINQIVQKHHKDVLVETFPSIPPDKQAEFDQQGKDRFFESWADQRAKQDAVDGVYLLICRKPGHLQVWDGNRTGQRLFTTADRDRLKGMLASAFRENQFDQGLDQGVAFIQQQMDAHVPSSGQMGSSGSAAMPPPVANNPQSNYPPSNSPQPSGRSGGWGLGGIACVVIGVIVLIMLVRGVIGRATGGYRPGGGGGYYPPGGGGGGYPPQGGPGYPPQGGYGYGGGGGGGGFGRGLLGGLLGGALGGYVGEKYAERGQQGGGGYAAPPAAGGGGGDYSSGVDTSGTSSGADFDSGGGGGGGADFGGGGADSSSGADFGGGGSGSDFGGGGGGGDSGSSGGSDF